MKKILTIAALVGATTVSFAQGTLNFQNTAATLISAGGAAMPGSATAVFHFAVFLAPSTTASAGGQTAALNDPLFQTVGGTTDNGTTAGRLVSRSGLAVGGSPGDTVDYIVRGWSANAGATWQEALASWNNGQPSQDIYIGTSPIGNNLILGGGVISPTALFGGGASQLLGFGLPLVVAIPEPSSMVLAGLGAASLLLFRRKN